MAINFVCCLHSNKLGAQTERCPIVGARCGLIADVARSTHQSICGRCFDASRKLSGDKMSRDSARKRLTV
jgi:hypothetical protein